jgi:peptidoglycan/xylan/chitin deacetylase (PgdA/CDA1 family)
VGAELMAALEFPEMSSASVLARSLGHAASSVLPGPAHRALTSAVKLLRRAASTRAGERVPELPLGRLASGQRPWRGRRAAALLTHDLDTPECVANLEIALAEEQRHGIRPVVTVLTGAGYRLDPGWIGELQARGVEIGLHGLTHDYAIGGRTPAAIREHLRRALDSLPLRPILYRAPAFAVTRRLALELVALGFRCDSSRTVYHPRYPSTRTLLPFRAPGASLHELPVALEDSWLFRDWRLDVGAALAYAERVLERAIESGGLVVVDTHPSILARHPGFYPALLDRFARRDELWLASFPQLLELLDAQCAG